MAWPNGALTRRYRIEIEAKMPFGRNEADLLRKLAHGLWHLQGHPGVVDEAREGDFIFPSTATRGRFNLGQQ